MDNYKMTLNDFFRSIQIIYIAKKISMLNEMFIIQFEFAVKTYSKNKKTSYNNLHIAGRGSVLRQLRLPATGRNSRFAIPCPSDRSARLNGRAGSSKSSPTTCTN